MRKIHKTFVCILAGAISLTGKAAITYASEEPIAGINLILEELFQDVDTKEDQIIQKLLEETIKLNSDLAFAKVTNYVNIRKDASEDSEILGKLYNESAATIISAKDDWYQIKSGAVAGYIKSEFLITGEKAAELAETLGKEIAIVNTTTLKVRKKASLDSEVLTLVPAGDELEVLKKLDGWVKVSLGGTDTGYVSADYVKINTIYEEAVSIEEELERLEEEAAARRQESVNNTGNGSQSESGSAGNAGVNKSESSNSSSGNHTSYEDSSLGSKIASYATQFEGNPYVWGGTSLTNGADCSGFTQSVFAHFGISIPRTSRTQASGGRKVSLDSLRVGDLVFYTRGGTINHVAIYIGSGKVISASSPETGIRITSYNYRQPYKAVSYIR